MACKLLLLLQLFFSTAVEDWFSISHFSTIHIARGSVSVPCGSFILSSQTPGNGKFFFPLLDILIQISPPIEDWIQYLYNVCNVVK